MRCAALLIVAAACGSSTVEKPATVTNEARPAEAPSVIVRYATYGLMPTARCGSPTYHIDVDRDGAVRCGWTSDCSERHLVMESKGRLEHDARARLAHEAEQPAFIDLKSKSNPHIIDGGVKELDVAGRTVTMVNDTAPAFEEFLALLVKETGCPEIGRTPR